MGRGYGSGNIYNVMRSYELHLEGLSLPLRGDYRKASAELRNGDVLRPIPLSRGACPDRLPALCKVEGLLRIFSGLLPDIFVVPVQKDHTLRGNRVGQLKLGFLDIVDRKEGLQVLGPHRSDDPVFRVHQVAELLDLPHPSGAHLADKDLMGRL